LIASCSASLRRGGDDLRAFLVGLALGFLDHRLGQPLGVGQALGGVVARRGQLLLDPLVGGGEVGLGLVGGGQAFADLGGALVERGGDRRPDLGHGEPDQEQEDDQLDDQGGGDAHVDASAGKRSGRRAGSAPDRRITW
jgi:hypothetical protein